MNKKTKHTQTFSHDRPVQKVHAPKKKNAKLSTRYHSPHWFFAFHSIGRLRKNFLLCSTNERNVCLLLVRLLEHIQIYIQHAMASINGAAPYSPECHTMAVVIIVSILSCLLRDCDCAFVQPFRRWWYGLSTEQKSSRYKSLLEQKHADIYVRSIYIMFAKNEIRIKEYRNDSMSGKRSFEWISFQFNWFLKNVFISPVQSKCLMHWYIYSMAWYRMASI